MDDNKQQVQGQQVAQQVPAQPVQQEVPSVPASAATPVSTTGEPSPVPVQSPTASDQPMQTLVDQIERDLLAHIYTNLKENKISGMVAQTLAKEFLALLPFKDKKDLVDKLSTLGEKYPEARQTYVNLGIPLEEQQRQERLEQMRAHIKAGDLDKALAVAKGGTPNGGNST